MEDEHIDMERDAGRLIVRPQVMFIRNCEIACRNPMLEQWQGSRHPRWLSTGPPAVGLQQAYAGGCLYF